MASKSAASSSSSQQKSFILYLLLVPLALFFILVLSFTPQPTLTAAICRLQNDDRLNSAARNVNVGLVNVDDTTETTAYELLGLTVSKTKTVNVGFDRVSEDLKWEDFFPEWIDEDEKWGPPKCPEIPMPARAADYGDLDVIIARVPCGGAGEKEKEGIRDVFRLQVNLVVANLVVRSGWVTPDVHRTVYVVFVGSCGPMVEIFRCDDLVMHQGDYWVYKPELRRLKQKVLMPFGTCQLAPSYAETGKEAWRPLSSESTPQKRKHTTHHHQREAYATVLHSSEAYVCGAIALAQSIIRTNSTKDLILLADDSIASNSLRGLRAAGWKIKRIKRILSPFAQKGSYNEWNYSKLRVWQLTDYDKIIFIDADLLVLKNIDKFFVHPQLSAAPNDKTIFNSGVMVIEPSMCVFKDLMEKSFKLGSYNGGDQGFLNEVFTWWHRLPAKLNHLKIYGGGSKDEKHEIPADVYAIHYLGLKPWMCYKEYDCNWDMPDHHPFASDSAHRRWWQVYEAMPKKLQPFCGLSEKMDARVRKWRGKARNAKLPDGHWKIKVNDPRRRRRFVE
ncbi:putative UDP-glucuronate:xylan alpha-glucuronosyltransferase 4 [Corylus avellana]|uniref:putative UDP-glucuronate:xylan alpha-glucuronosyltransferase 4 n=1 Tax=Corylus avellana TaxID=13451 RepID=UPI001E1EBE73|nr:putative UDP-glucuronate:xylan alpha-glucuronosyltransferase 4 [Corylus avellana]